MDQILGWIGCAFILVMYAFMSMKKFWPSILCSMLGASLLFAMGIMTNNPVIIFINFAILVINAIGVVRELGKLKNS